MEQQQTLEPGHPSVMVGLQWSWAELPVSLVSQASSRMADIRYTNNAH